ncbi:MAG: DUF1003 domain-containing protein [Amaricoccus sp.]
MSPHAPRSGDEDEVGEPLSENIAALMDRRARELAESPFSERISARVAGFLGSLWSVAAHALVFGTWMLVNLGFVPGVRPFDPTLVVLGMVASVEAIFLTTFVLINQNSLARSEDERNELALQVALLSEREVTELVELIARIARRIEVPVEPENRPPHRGDATECGARRDPPAPALRSARIGAAQSIRGVPRRAGSFDNGLG